MVSAPYLDSATLAPLTERSPGGGREGACRQKAAAPTGPVAPSATGLVLLLTGGGRRPSFWNWRELSYAGASAWWLGGELRGVWSGPTHLVSKGVGGS